ncbi:PH domain-containing protein [Staphylococcus americanisciuri]|uniref:PH domain-containing protein n=1 Tax=Staphylococcus americanisciuri TaxID=2973940 RepID=A0ABT2F0T2_9STAP|nr:PH domain-containing protein [Staphylococcus americanisciuri]MCS4486036.1 PH domain-containing protein [Staphylococcus americanisciuri]
MILDRVNPEDLFPTEKTGPTVLGKIEYQVNGQREFEGAYIATNERLIMNVDMNGQFYYRNIPYNEISSITLEDDVLWIGFEIGNVAMRQINKGDINDFVDYVQQQINKYTKA